MGSIRIVLVSSWGERSTEALRSSTRAGIARCRYRGRSNREGSCKRLV